MFYNEKLPRSQVKWTTEKVNSSLSGWLNEWMNQWMNEQINEWVAAVFMEDN